MTVAFDQRPHALYRFYGAGGTLLYIGITADLPTRLSNHREGKTWWLGVTNVTVEHYPDRTSVLKAERAAIIAEKPLYNTQHNGPPPPPKVVTRTQVVTSSPLTPVCMGCHQVIPRGDKGVVHAKYAEFLAREEADRELSKWEDEQRAASGGMWVISAAALMDRYKSLPPRGRWRVHCDGCNPHPDDPDDPRSWCSGCYWFSTDRCRTWAQLIDWTCHLSEKNWFGATNWMDFIRATAHGTKTGLVANPRDTKGADA